MTKKQHIITYSALSVLSILMGLFTRSEIISPKSFVYQFVGDMLWASMIYFAFSILNYRGLASKVALYSICFCFAIEFSQLLKFEWLNTLRSFTIGKLILGQGFLIDDLLCYCIGVLVAFLITTFFLKEKLVGDC